MARRGASRNNIIEEIPQKEHWLHSSNRAIRDHRSKGALYTKGITRKQKKNL